MRIGFFTNNYAPWVGGVTTAVETLRAGLEQRGHEVFVFAPRFPAHNAAPGRIIRYRSIPALTYPEFVLPIPFSPAISRLVRRLDLDLFHAHHPFLLGRTALRLARRGGRPLVFTYHTRYEKYAHYVPLPQGWVQKRAAARATRFANHADLVIAPSKATRTTLEAQGVRTRIEVVPTGIPQARIGPGPREALRTQLGFSDRARLVLSVGRLDPEKNLPTLFRAFDFAAQQVDPAHLLVVGKGTHEPHLRALAATLPSASRIHFLGAVPYEKVLDVYRAADVFLFASTTETQGLVVAEALAVGLPVVALRAPGMDEIVAHGMTGALAESPAALAAALVTLLRSDEQRAAFVRAALQRASDLSADTHVNRVVGLYEELLRGGARRE